MTQRIRSPRLGAPTQEDNPKANDPDTDRWDTDVVMGPWVGGNYVDTVYVLTQCVDSVAEDSVNPKP